MANRWRDWKKGIEAAERVVRLDVEARGEVSRSVAGRLNGPSIGSVAVDTRGGALIGTVHNYLRGIAYLREPGSSGSVWSCPYSHIDRPTREQVALAQMLDAGVELYQEDGAIKGRNDHADPSAAAG
ncbi:hypothetical protein [Kitasatospora sp. NPDC098663]|uniref:hypothetical protein n=1 Tax=Kitasatospora sp. NPDC098663 TaxID=3364096 RepID=UPI0037FC1166